MQNFQLCLSKFKYVYLASKCDRRQIDSLTIDLLGNSCNNCSDCQRASAHLICTLWRQLLQRHSEIHSATFSSWVYGDGFNCTMNSSSSQFKNQVRRKNSCCAAHGNFKKFLEDGIKSWVYFGFLKKSAHYFSIMHVFRELSEGPLVLCCAFVSVVGTARSLQQSLWMLLVSVAVVPVSPFCWCFCMP